MSTRFVLRAAAGAALALAAVTACETANFTVLRDLQAPTITLTPVGSDTQDIANGMSFSANVTDNVGVDSVFLTYSGGYIATQDTGFATTTATTIGITLSPAVLAGSGGPIRIIGRSKDVSGNFSAPDTVTIILVNPQALQVILLQPITGAQGSTGKFIPVQVKAIQLSGGIRRVGWSVTNPSGPGLASPVADSLSLGTGPFPDSTIFTDSVKITGTTGNFDIVGFAVDSSGRRGLSSPVTVTIQSAINDKTPPVVLQTVAPRVEVGDSVTISVTDNCCVTRLGFRVRNTGGGTVSADSVLLSGGATQVTRTLALKLDTITTFPRTVTIQSFGVDSAGNRGLSATATLTVVAGHTVALPAGGAIADLIYNKNTNEVYLTNTALSRLEIFQVANSTFVAKGIPTAGPQPVGIALWPVDTLGDYSDTVVVADAGGTELSVIDVRPAVRRLRWRQDLPNYRLATYKTQQTTGGYQAVRTLYDLSDRPQYVATVCRPTTGVSTCAADSVYALYSTTPTTSSTSPFSGFSTLRMEKLVNTTNPALLFGHFFWEYSSSINEVGSDTIEVTLRRGAPYNVTIVTLSVCAGVRAKLGDLAFGSQGLVRNSGNFTHAFFGEGGSISTAFARVVGYSAKASLVAGAGTFTTCQTTPDPSLVESGDNDVDFGMSPAVDVSDFISNTGVRVQSIATNFNGLTNIVRADSIYYLDEGLRLKGSSEIASGGAFGIDMNYNHAFAAGQPGTPTFGGSGSPNDRLVFAADPNGNIDVFDTFFYGLVKSIPVRDPITGPLRVAKDASGNQLLFGMTARGLVLLRLPAITNPNPAPQR